MQGYAVCLVCSARPGKTEAIDTKAMASASAFIEWQRKMKKNVANH